MDALPSLLTQLTTAATNGQGQTAGPFIKTIPSGPTNWGAYAYTPAMTAGTFTIVNSGDGTSVSVP